MLTPVRPFVPLNVFCWGLPLMVVVENHPYESGSVASFLTLRGIGYIFRISASRAACLSNILSRSCLSAFLPSGLRALAASCSYPTLRI